MEAASERFSRRQIGLLVLIGTTYSIAAFNHTLPTFHGYTPAYHCCQLNDEGNVTRVEGCVKQSEECVGGYQFESPRNETSIVTEWELVCDRRLLWPLTATLYFCGVMIGALVCGMLADRYGRRPVMLVCLYGQGALGLALYVTYSLEAFIAVRFIQGFFVQGLQGSTYTLLMELFPRSARTAVGIVLELYWALGLVLLAGLAYLLPHWRSLQLALTVPTLLTLLFVCIIPESPRWLAINGRSQPAATRCQKKSQPNSNTQQKSANHESDEQPLDHSPSESESTDNIEAASSRSIQLESHQDDNKFYTCLGARTGDTGAVENSRTMSLRKGEEKDSQVSKNQCDIDSASVNSNPGTVVADKNEMNQYITINSEVSQFRGGFERVGSTPLISHAIGEISKETIVLNSKTGTCVELEESKERKYGILDLFRSQVLRKFNFIMVFNWFSISLSYYGIMFYLPDLSGDRHLNFFIGALLEAVSYVAAYFVLDRFGRRVPLAVYLMLSGVLCISVGGIGMTQQAGTTDILAGLQTALALLGKAAVVSAFCSIFIYTSELFPTVVRAAAMGYCGLWSRFGSLLSPQLLLLGEYTSKIVPPVTMGVLVIMAGCSTLLLPETFGSPLADTVEQAEEMQQNRKKKNKHPTN